MGDLLLFLSLLLIVCSLPPTQRNVISTEAAHAFVSSGAEKSASLPKLTQPHAPQKEKPLIQGVSQESLT
jgi:hypothetical protein